MSKITIDKKTLLKLIDDYGHAMYNLGEDSGDYEARQAGITKKRITVYLEYLENNKEK